MNTTRILISNELESYREALGEVFRTLRPGFEIFEADSGDLDRKVERLHPGLVVCSRATNSVRKSVPVWVELYPDCEPLSVVSVSGRRREVESIELSELLDLADRADVIRRKREDKVRESSGAAEGSTAV